MQSDIEEIADDAQRALDFVLNRLDGIAEQVIDWMPPEDNEVHHNAVEQLQRAFEVTRKVREDLRGALGYRRLPGEDRYKYSALLSDLTHVGAHNLTGGVRPRG